MHGVRTSRVADIVLGTLRREVSEDHSWVRPDQANDQCTRLRLVGLASWGQKLVGVNWAGLGFWSSLFAGVGWTESKLQVSHGSQSTPVGLARSEGRVTTVNKI